MAKKRGKGDEGTGVLLAVGFVIWVIIKLIWLILGVLALVAAYFIGRELLRAVRRRRAERDAYYAAVCARADQQHAWALAGDDRGVFGVEGAKLMRQIRRT